MSFYCHPRAACESTSVGERTRIWAFVHVLPGAVIGDDCNICDHVFIENDVRIGNRVTVKCGVQLWDGITIEDDVFIGPNATFTNDLHPPNRRGVGKFEPLATRVCERASIGANATILPGLVIGPNAMIGAGAVVTRSVPANAVVTGNPARIVGYQDKSESSLPDANASASGKGARKSAPELAVWYSTRQDDSQPVLISLGDEGSVPFAPEQFRLVLGGARVREVPLISAAQELRYVQCVRGTCVLAIEERGAHREIVLDDPRAGVLISPQAQFSFTQLSDDAAAFVFSRRDQSDN